MTRNLITLNIGEHASGDPPTEGKPIVILNGRAIEAVTFLGMEANNESFTKVTLEIYAAIGEQELKPDYDNDYYTDPKELEERLLQLKEQIKGYNQLTDSLKKANVVNSFLSNVNDYRWACLNAASRAEGLYVRMRDLGIIVPKSLFTDATIYKDCIHHADATQEQ